MPPETVVAREARSEPDRVRVPGIMDADGDVKCPCGRLVGLVHDHGVEFFCRHCRVNVTVDLRASKLEKLAKMADLLMEVAREIAAI